MFPAARRGHRPSSRDASRRPGCSPPGPRQTNGSRQMGMSDWWRVLLALFVWPGLVGGALLGWFYVWMARKLTARVQGRKGPPFYQPCFDFIKLLGKEILVPGGINRALF